MADPLTKPCAMEYCVTRIKPRMLMCGWHWHQVPRDIKDRIFNTLYEWERCGASSAPYLLAVAEAKLVCAKHEHRSNQQIALLETEVARYAAITRNGGRP